MAIAIPAIYIGSNVDKFSRHVQDMSDTQHWQLTMYIFSGKHKCRRPCRGSSWAQRWGSRRSRVEWWRRGAEGHRRGRGPEDLYPGRARDSGEWRGSTDSGPVQSLTQQSCQISNIRVITILLVGCQVYDLVTFHNYYKTRLLYSSALLRILSHYCLSAFIDHWTCF